MSLAMREWLTDPLLVLFVATLLLGFFALLPKRASRSPGTSHERRRRVRAGFLRWFFFLLTIAAFLVSSAPAIVNPLVAMQENRYTDTSSECAQNAPVVVLAGGLVWDPKSSDEFLSMTRPTMRRSVAGYEHATKLESNRLILAGGGLYEIAEAEVMAEYIAGLGFPMENIVLEAESENTWESALAVSKILNEKTWPKEIHLVTSALHMQRASQSFEAMNLKVCTVPADHIAQKGLPFYALTPNSAELSKFDMLLHEWLGLLAYRSSSRIR